ncbi:formylmethanofuran dehydrogenase subunit B [Methanocella sp. CWC-04]|uniref:Formylmethanofuran dehydrogenase subunit B n=1 Tax=Methanooceanicella nereidis TaxID=2052831 RepID=A0AAP2RBZ7_9EURY|nr:formylmethanofuran dehydrogenase subunit B [Methanocella sp. CWC-04]
MTCTDVTCPVCGMSCDDIYIELTDDAVLTKNACLMGDAKFQELRSHHRLTKPLVHGEEASWDEALEKTADILVNAKRPFFFMGSETSNEAMAVGIEIAEYLGGLVDGNATICHGPTIMGLQLSGQVGSTLGECKNRADLNIYWGCNPADSHPRHMSRHSQFARGFWTEQGFKGRKVIVVDPRRSPTCEAADLHVQLKPGKDHELIDALMTMLRGEEPHPTVEEVTGVSRETLNKMAEMVKECKFGVIWVGLGIASSRGHHYNAAIAMRFTHECNKFTKFVINANRGHCNVAGFNQVLAWTHGFPFAVDFSRGIPRYQPGEYSCVDALSRGEVDAMIVMCANLGGHLPKKAVERLAKIPMIAIETSPGTNAFMSDIILPGVFDGMECEGTFYRMDNVPIYARSFTKPPFDFTESNEHTLKQLFEIVKKKKAEKDAREAKQ